MFQLNRASAVIRSFERKIVHRYLSITLLSAAMAVMSGCQTMGLSPTADSTASHPLTAQMPVMDRQGRLAYIEEHGIGKDKVSSLYSIRPDGSDRQLIDQINGYIYAPTWSADGQLLAYSKQGQRDYIKIYSYNYRNDSISLIVEGSGSSLSPSFAPDGQKLLYSSTVGGNADIYELNLSDGSRRQLTTLPSTEAQPSYAPDGNSFVYVSDKVRAGSPRIYRYNFATKTSQPIATSGYAASPQLSLDGTRLSYLNGKQAALMTLATGRVINLADTGIDEPARLSPSGQYSVYATMQAEGRGQKASSLVIRSLSGGTSYRISSKTGGLVRSPTWGR